MGSELEEADLAVSAGDLYVGRVDDSPGRLLTPIRILMRC